MITNSVYINARVCNYQLFSRLDTCLYRDKAVYMCYWKTAVLISSCQVIWQDFVVLLSFFWWMVLYQTFIWLFKIRHRLRFSGNRASYSRGLQIESWRFNGLFWQTFSWFSLPYEAKIDISLPVVSCSFEFVTDPVSYRSTLRGLSYLGRRKIATHKQEPFHVTRAV